jgi:hypothetical protein
VKASLKWRIDQGRRTISPMVDKNEFVKALIVSVFVTLITLVPYGVAYFQANPESTFSGFLVNPIDGFSYLAKMRQGFDGNWLFQLPYTVEPGEGSFIFVYFLFLGHISRCIGIPSIYLYHLARLLGSVVMFCTAFLLIAKFLEKRKLRWGAFFIVLFGAGFGWMGLPFGIFASDLWIVESIPFLTAYANAHFPFATALFLALIVLMVTDKKPSWLNVGVAFVFSTLLAAIQPFSTITLFVFLFLWLAWETRIEVKDLRDFKWVNGMGRKWLTFSAMIMGALPWFIYDYWLTVNHPQIAAWNAQNKTPSPPLYEYLLGYGGVLLLAFLGLIKGGFKEEKSERLLFVWASAQALLLYAPFGLQRRLNLGLYFALVILAVIPLDKWITIRGRFRLAIFLLIILTLPSNLIVVSSGIVGVIQNDSSVVLENGEMDAYQWLASNTDPGEIILAGPRAGNRIPAFADLRVYYGHPFETPDAENQKAFIEGIFSSVDPIRLSSDELLDQGVSYVFYGPEEKELGRPDWLKDQELIFRSGEYAIYEISNP